MKVKICKVKEKDIKSWWRLNPRIPKQDISQKESLKPIFSFGTIKRLWFGSIIIGDRYEVKKSCIPTFASKVLDLSCFSEEAEKNKT